MAANKPAEKAKANEIAIVRIYDAPVEMVWDAWVDPDQVAKWWGPRGFTLTTYQKDVRPGGTWTYTMHGPDGTDWPNRTEFLEVEKHSLLVYDHGANDTQPALFRVRVEFKRLGKKTQMNMRMILATPEAAAETKRFVKKAGGESTWDRLGEFLDERLHKKNRFIINRSFEAPLAQMFEMWTKPEHFQRWLPPTGATMAFIRADIRAGGESFYYMDPTGGARMYGKAKYHEIVPPIDGASARIVYSQQFCDESEAMARHPMAPTWPAFMLTVVELTAEGPDATRVTVTWEPHPESTQAEVDTFMAARAGMTLGWTGSFDKLEELLAAFNRADASF